MSGFKNDVVFAKNADFSQVNNSSPSESNGLATDGQLWTGSTAVNAGGTHVNVGQMTSPNNSITFGYSSPNITAVVNTSVISDLHVTPYIVSAAGLTNGANYTNIQSACDAANAMGGGIVVVQPGTYVENLTLYNGVHITGLTFADAGGGVTIEGVHTPPTTGGFAFNNVQLISATHIFSSNAAGSAHLIIGNAAITITNGYTYNLPNWTGKLETYDVNDRSSTNDGFINNTGGSEIAIFSAAVGAGTVNTMTLSGAVSIFSCAVGCPINFVTGSNSFLEYNVHLAPITFSNNSTGEIIGCEIDSFVTMSSSSAWLISDCVINTSNNPAIAGAGAGTLTLADVTFINNSSFASTVNLASKATFLRTPIYTDRGSSLTVRLNSGSFVTATSTLTTPPTTGLSDGDRLEFVVTNGTLTIQLAATQIAHIGTLSTSAAGTITSTNTGDALVLKYQASTNDWWATSVIGTWLIA